MSKVLIEADRLCVKTGSKTILDEISFTICQGEAWAITGPAGSGKSTLANVIKNRHPVASGKLTTHLSPEAKVVLVEQQHTYKNRTDASSTYYQARFDSVSSEDFPLVEEVLQASGPRDKSVEYIGERIEEILHLLNISYLRHTRLIQLSNGENKRFQLAKALLQEPKMLILDNPFVGLDQEARQVLHAVINQLILQEMIILLITDATEIPEQVTHVMELEEGRLIRLATRASFLTRQKQLPASLPGAAWLKQDILQTMQVRPDHSFEVAVSMQDVTVRYGGRKILDQVNWQVNRGEKWAISGPNGAGKSTLLSLINGDNPQAYANTIVLFDQRRGSGESIWDIKRKIGYISPELHLHFNRRMRCFEAVASGLTDKMICDKNLSEAQKNVVYQWLDIFHLTDQQHVLLADMPLSEQRLVLLARALVKNPPVLILDEPCQGLDARQTDNFKAMIDTICQHVEKTLIYVSHYQQDIPACVDRLLRLAQGKATVIRLER